MEKMIQVKNLKQHFKLGNSLANKHNGLIKAVDDVSFYIKKGETFGLVGESGSGKTTLGHTLINLYKPTSGKVFFNNKEVIYNSERQFKEFRRKMQYIFQDPYASLNPRMTVAEIVGEPLDVHKLASGRKERAEKINSLLSAVGLSSEHASRYPHEFSGGQRQRIGIARALAVEPELIVCDEPVSALDVSIRAQILNMLEEMQEERNLTYLFISHDMSVIRHISDRVGVMYLGKMIELAGVDDIFCNPVHPYTRALVSSIPEPDPEINRAKKRIILTGEIPSPINPPSGCKFHTRCPYAQDICRNNEPTLVEVSEGHAVACHFSGKV